MQPSQYRRVKELFSELRGLDEATVEAVLAERCAGDLDLQLEVTELLRHDREVSEGALGEALAAPKDPDLAVPESIGPYLIGEHLGAGGMGDVYLAEQRHPIQRTVALKLIRAGLESKAVVARFETERQALAMMQHRNIARAYDAGATKDGQPFFVMEYVDGLPINEYCDQARLNTLERLELLAQVCDGLQHAHQKAVIHRDIKPSNVLVAIEDGVAIPKIIDFGVAKAARRPLNEETMFTEVGQLVGTPDYMSPEQASLDGGSVDTRSDIYSVGVLMYEVLVGALPFDRGELQKAGLEAILKRIREVDPPRPSTRVRSQSPADGRTMESRHTTLHRLAAELRGELDWITMKALEKDPSRRYGSASEFADDLRRFLKHEPVSAGPPGLRYRASKYLRRHRIAASFVALAGLFLAVFVLSNYRQSRVIAAERDRASAEAEASSQLSGFLIGLFKDADPARAKGADVTARDLLDVAAKKIDALGGQPLVQATFAEAIGGVYGTIGLFEEGRRLLEKARAFRESKRDGSKANELAYAASALELGVLLMKSGLGNEGLHLVRESAQIREELLGPSTELAASLSGYGNGLWNTGEMDEAEVQHRRALEMRQQTLGPRHTLVASSLHNVASLLFIGGDLEAAEKMYLQSIDIAEEVEGPNDYGVATSLHTLAMVYSESGRYEEAIPLEERALAIREDVLGDKHPHVALSLTTLAEIHQGLGDPAKAEPLARRAVVIGLEAWGPDFQDVWWMQRGHAAALNGLGRHTDALAVMEPLVALVKAAPRRTELSLHLAELGATYLGLSRAADAQSCYEESLRISDDAGDGEEAAAGAARIGLANAQRDLGRTEEAETNYRAAIASLEDSANPADPNRIRGLREYAKMLQALGRGELAAEKLAEADRLSRR